MLTRKRRIQLAQHATYRVAALVPNLLCRVLLDSCSCCSAKWSANRKIILHLPIRKHRKEVEQNKSRNTKEKMYIFDKNLVGKKCNQFEKFALFNCYQW
uniref:Uncharacterized protein n=1 Tax=Daphnia magna TaxID=35525 RepID=A0A0N8AVJ9_9CRUS